MLIQCILAPALFCYFIWCFLTYQLRFLKMKDRWSVRNKELDGKGGPDGRLPEQLYVRTGPLVLFGVTGFLVAVMCMSAVLQLGKIWRNNFFGESDGGRSH